MLGLVLLAAGALGGFAWWHDTHDTRTFTDDRNVLSVTVPTSWARDVSLSGWNPPGSTDGRPALAIGDRPDWRAKGQGVFLGLLSERRIPQHLPQHPSCGNAGPPQRGTYDSDPAVTVVTSGCGGVIVERVVQVSRTALLWVQVRSHDETTADEVLDSVKTQGSLD